jgi:hypothetical protein
MTYENIKEKLKTAWFLLWGVLAGVQRCFIVYLATVRSIGDFLSLLLFKEEAAILCIKDRWNIKISTIFSYGIHLVIILVLLFLIFLKSQRCKYLSKTKKFIHGEYLFTIDWAHPDSNILDSEHSEIPHEHKCGHVLALDNGNYAIQPNNRILWNVPSFTTSTHWPDYKVQTSKWNVENKDWVTEDSDNMFYQVEDKK